MVVSQYLLWSELTQSFLNWVTVWRVSWVFSLNSFKVVWWKPKHEDKTLCLCQNHSFLSRKKVLAAVWSRRWTRPTNKNKQLLNNQEAKTTNTCSCCQHLQPASKTKMGTLISSLLMLARHHGCLLKSSSSSQKKTNTFYFHEVFVDAIYSFIRILKNALIISNFNEPLSRCVSHKELSLMYLIISKIYIYIIIFPAFSPDFHWTLSVTFS